MVDAALGTAASQLCRYELYPQVQAPTAASTAATTDANADLPPDAASAWLAGEVYALLGEHLALPVPPNSLSLDHLYASLSPAEQAALDGQRQAIHEQLLALLDDLPLTPPPIPSFPEEWIPLIDAALDNRQLLRLTYFTAGRNLTTQRLVEPYWCEEHRGVPYLRAYCHSAERVLLFRLDRIQSLAVIGSRE